MFDADGVLFESFESNIAYYNAIFAQLGEPPLDADEEIKSISYAAADVFKLRAKENAQMLERIHGVARTIDQRPFFELLRPPFELRPFMMDLKRRYRLGLATNRSATVPALVEFPQTRRRLRCDRKRARQGPSQARAGYPAAMPRARASRSRKCHLHWRQSHRSRRCGRLRDCVHRGGHARRASPSHRVAARAR